MCFYQSQAFCTCCKKRIYRQPDDDEPYKLSCNLHRRCTFVRITVVSYEKCLMCFECESNCESGRLPVDIYYVSHLNKCFMLFEAHENDDFCFVYNIFSRIPL